jgi:hypothetical protein
MPQSWTKLTVTNNTQRATCIEAHIVSTLQQYSLCSYFPFATGIFGVVTAAFLVFLYLDHRRMLLEDRQMAAVPVCPPDNRELILFPKPENCSEFYQCLGGVAFTHECPEDLYYCEEKQYCTWITETGCKFDCVLTKRPTECPTKEPTEGPTAKPTPDSICSPQNEGLFVPNPDDCTKYYECSNGETIPFRCPDGLFFCPQSNTCDWLCDKECTYDCVAVNK